jgi:hypothetical protein
MANESKVRILGIPLEWLIKMLIQLLSQVIDAIVPGERLTHNQKKVVRLAFYLGKDWGQDAVDDTETDLDNEALEQMMTACEETAREGGFALPVVEPLS